MEDVFDALGIKVAKVTHEPNGPNAVPLLGDYQRDLYAAIESAGPAILGFELKPPPSTTGTAAAAVAGGRHVIGVFGHTFNDDAWVPDAQREYFVDGLGYYSSENWLSAYVVHDDNFGPYYCLPRHFLTKQNFRLLYGVKILPTVFTGVEAELIALAYLSFLATSLLPSAGIKWYDRFAAFAQNQQLVLRSLHVTKEQYLRHLRACEEPTGKRIESDAIEQFEKRLPNTFWLVEASAPELFPTTRRKFGEVLIAADKAIPTPLNYDLLVAYRLPGIMLWIEGGNFVSRNTALDGHCKLFSYAD